MSRKQVRQGKPARREIGEYVHYYQSERRHLALGYLAPEQFERLEPCGGLGAAEAQVRDVRNWQRLHQDRLGAERCRFSDR
jgi:hypothetical protein